MSTGCNISRSSATRLAFGMVVLSLLASTIGMAMASSELREMFLMVIRHPADGRMVLAVSDLRSGFRMSGLEPGDYTVQPSSGVRVPGLQPGDLAVQPSSGAAAMKVGLGGRLAVAVRDRSSMTLEQLDFPRDAAKDDVLSASRNGLIDVNQSSASVLMADTRNSNEAAALIIAERHGNGPYRNPQDFAQRVCTKVDIDFEFARVQFGDTLVIPQPSGPAVPGFSCRKGVERFQMLGREFPQQGSFVFSL